LDYQVRSGLAAQLHQPTNLVFAKITNHELVNEIMMEVNFKVIFSASIEMLCVVIAKTQCCHAQGKKAI